MTKGDILNLWQAIIQVQDLKGQIKFSYGIIKNKKLIQDEVDTLQEIINVKEYGDFIREKMEVINKYGAKDSKGKLLEINGQYTFQPDKEIIAHNEIEQLVVKYKKAITEYENKVKDLDEILKEEIEIKLYTLPLEVFPTGITPKQMESLWCIIEE